MKITLTKAKIVDMAKYSTFFWNASVAQKLYPRHKINILF